MVKISRDKRIIWNYNERIQHQERKGNFEKIEKAHLTLKMKKIKSLKWKIQWTD